MSKIEKSLCHPDKCKFCGDTRPPLDQWGYCKVCVDGMKRTNGD